MKLVSRLASSKSTTPRTAAIGWTEQHGGSSPATGNLTFLPSTPTLNNYLCGHDRSVAETSCDLHIFISTPKLLTALGVFARDKQVLFTAAVSAACLCVLDYWGNACDMTDWKVWRAQTVKLPLAPAYKQRGKAFFFLRGEVYGWKGQDE